MNPLSSISKIFSGSKRGFISVQNEYKDITQHEIKALTYKYNLADAHTHQSQSPSQRKIIQRLPTLWYEAEQTPQQEMERRFIQNFFRVQKQPHALKTDTIMLVYASSIAMVIIANYLLKKKMSVSLLEPCFDNLHDILEHLQVPVSPLREEWLHHPAILYDTLKKHVTTDALFIIDPNNPTGSTLFSHGAKAYKELLRYANNYKKLLIIDFCFAPFADYSENLQVCKVYQLLEKSGVDYIAIEDTGKTWPLQDTKVAMLKTSTGIFPEIYNIHTSYLLNVSPFILNLVTQYILDSQKDGFDSVYSLLRRNLDIVRKQLKGSLLELQEPDVIVSVAWLKIKNPKITGSWLQQEILTHGVYILPGTYFYWSDHNQGESYVRIALARNTAMFKEAIHILRNALSTIEKTL